MSFEQQSQLDIAEFLRKLTDPGGSSFPGSNPGAFPPPTVPRIPAPTSIPQQTQTQAQPPVLTQPPPTPSIEDMIKEELDTRYGRRKGAKKLEKFLGIIQGIADIGIPLAQGYYRMPVAESPVSAARKKAVERFKLEQPERLRMAEIFAQNQRAALTDDRQRDLAEAKNRIAEATLALKEAQRADNKPKLLEQTAKLKAESARLNGLMSGTTPEGAAKLAELSADIERTLASANLNNTRAAQMAPDNVFQVMGLASQAEAAGNMDEANRLKSLAEQMLMSQAALKQAGMTKISQNFINEATGEGYRLSGPVPGGFQMPDIFKRGQQPAQVTPTVPGTQIVPQTTGRIPGYPNSLSTQEAGLAGRPIPTPGQELGKRLGPGESNVTPRGYPVDTLETVNKAIALDPNYAKRRVAMRGVTNANTAYKNQLIAAYMNGDLEKLSGPLEGSEVGRLFRELGSSLDTTKAFEQGINRFEVSAQLKTDLADFMTSRISNLGLQIEGATFGRKIGSAESKIIQAIMRDWSIRLGALESAGTPEQKKAAESILRDPNRLGALARTATAYAGVLEALKRSGLKDVIPEQPNLFEAADPSRSLLDRNNPGRDLIKLPPQLANKVRGLSRTKPIYAK